MTAPALSDSDSPAPGRRRRNRGSEVVRDALVNAAMVEFAAHGFDGASTRRIAEAAGAHQSQIAYHFDSKAELWRRCVSLLIDELDAEVAAGLDRVDRDDPQAAMEALIRGLVRFASTHPELSRLMMHEGTTPGPRLAWLVDTKLQRRHATIAAAWQELLDDGTVAPIDADLLYHSVIGAASLIYANAPEAVLLGIEPADPDLVRRHEDALVALFLRPTSRTGPP
ncbi:MAG: TetR/AcrR family transcriptional regulator [Actinomycetota bacterium]